MLLFKFNKFINQLLPLNNVIKTTTTTTSKKSSLNYHLNQYCHNTKYRLNGINTSDNNNNNNNNSINGLDMVIQTSMTNVKRILKSSEIPFEDGFTTIKTYCPICTNDQIMDMEKRKIFINKITGNVICPGCQHVGNWSMYEKFFLQIKTSKKQSPNKELDKVKEHFLTKKKSTKRQLKIPDDNLILCQHLPLEEFKDILTTLNLSNFPETIFYDLNASYDAIQQHLYFPLLNIHNEIVGYKILKYNLQETAFEEETLPDRKCFGLIVYKNKSTVAAVANQQSISQSISKSSSEKTSRNNSIIVLNLLDLLALSVQPKINYTIICLPHGYKSLPQECLPGIESYQKLILWFNYDGGGGVDTAAVGWDTAKMFGKKFDEKRCLFVRPTEQHPTPYEALLRNADIKGILTKAQPILHKSITTFQALRQDVLSDLQNIDKVQGVKWIRYPQLNKLLKGHRKGELTVLTGPTGCGKTTFMSEYSLDLTIQGVTTLWGSFEIRNTRLASTLLRQMAGCPLDENLNQFNYWADQFEHLPMYFMTFHGQQTIKIVMEAIEHAQYVHDIQHVIIDNVQFMMGTADESKHLDRFWKQDAIISAFRTFATKKNCHVTLVMHPRKERDAEDLTTSSIFGSAKATQEADNVLIIQDKRLTSVRGKKYLQVAKNRYCGDLGIMPLDFDKHSLSYAQTKKIKKDEPNNKSSGEMMDAE